MGATSLARLLGVAPVPDDRRPARSPPTSGSTPSYVRFAYVDDRDVLHGVDLHVARRAGGDGRSVGRRQVDAGPVVAGIHPPRTGSVTVGGVGLADLPLDDLRGHVALVTQEHHVFVGTLRENLALSRRAGVRRRAVRALDAVDAHDWAAPCRTGLDTRSAPAAGR